MKIKVLVMYLCIVLLINFAYIFSVKAYVEDRAYSVGDKIILDNELYYTIAPSNSDQRYVTVMKDDPLTADEVNTYKRVYISGDETSSTNGGIAYFTSDNCNYSSYSGCTTDYQKSDIKYLIDNWVKTKSFNDSLIEVDGYKARLIKFEELRDNLGYNKAIWVATNYTVDKENTPDWVYKSQNCYGYWTMSPYQDYPFYLYSLRDNGDLGYIYVWSNMLCVKPVLNIAKDSPKIQYITNTQNQNDEQKDNIMTTIVKVTDTFIEKSFIPSIIGGIGLVVGLIIYGIIRYRSNKN